MANVSTMDTEAAVAQAIRMIEAGAEYVRFTAQGEREARNLQNIRRELTAKGYDTPLVADIHFNPKAADEAALHVEKVRINPGNYADTPEHIRERFIPFLKLCREHHTAIRIGVNHGSLSERILNRYGDTPEGMVESCMEYLRICVEEGFSNVVISVKASNTVVMIQTVRLLVSTMDAEGMCFPIHLGVTEAGEGEDGRIKSAVGIGTLLAEGIGDTVRVSLSEEPEAELPVARLLVDYFSGEGSRNDGPDCFVPRNDGIVWIEDKPRDDAKYINLTYNDLNEEIINLLKKDSDTIVVLSGNSIGDMRAFMLEIRQSGCSNQVVLRRDYDETDLEPLQIKAAADFGALLIDGFGDGILLKNNNDSVSNDLIISTIYSILQAARVKITKTEYISCPGCGRTLFNLQKTVRQVKEATQHLKGLKIAVMGCIVNGPGEMADADYGYVGAGKGKISLYKGKECVMKNIPEEEAVTRLLEIINTK
jgi:(E)-4-hydroxy-3-methylbut-2-enyl-diphosphate synthase